MGHSSVPFTSLPMRYRRELGLMNFKEVDFLRDDLLSCFCLRKTTFNVFVCYLKKLIDFFLNGITRMSISRHYNDYILVFQFYINKYFLIYIK